MRLQIQCIPTSALPRSESSGEEEHRKQTHRSWVYHQVFCKHHSVNDIRRNLWYACTDSLRFENLSGTYQDNNSFTYYRKTISVATVSGSMMNLRTLTCLVNNSLWSVTAPILKIINLRLILCPQKDRIYVYFYHFINPHQNSLSDTPSSLWNTSPPSSSLVRANQNVKQQGSANWQSNECATRSSQNPCQRTNVLNFNFSQMKCVKKVQCLELACFLNTKHSGAIWVGSR